MNRPSDGDRELQDHWQRHDAFLDSGAFSAFTQGARIALDDYVRYCHATRARYTVQAVLDVIGDARRTAENQRAMETAGLQPLPTFHLGSDQRELARLCGRYDYLALGGLVPLARQKAKLVAWLDRCWATIRRARWPVRVHGFGMTGWDVLTRFPWYSVDSATGIRAGAFGGAIEFRDGALRSVGMVSRRLSSGHEHLADNVGSAHIRRKAFNIASLLAAERHLTELWTARGVVWA